MTAILFRALWVVTGALAVGGPLAAPPVARRVGVARDGPGRRRVAAGAGGVWGGGPRSGGQPVPGCGGESVRDHGLRRRSPYP